MFKLSKLTLAVILSTGLIGCTNIDKSYKTTLQDFQQYKELTQQYDIKENWWTLYQDSQLNKLVEQALDNNKDLAKAGISVNIALYKANLLGANLLPNFSGSTISKATKNIKEGGNSIISHTGTFDVSYTVDLWNRLKDAKSAAEWTHSASQQDLQAAKLSLINAVVATYYQLSYLNDAISVSNQMINYYSKITNIMNNKFKAGVVNRAMVDQSQQAILAAKGNLIAYETQKKAVETTLRNLLNLKPNESLVIHYQDILKVKNIGINLNIPISTIANRPDVKSSQYHLNSAFKDAKAMQKSWFPSITLGASLSSSGNKIHNSLSTPIAAGTLAINLPFLSWNTVKWNVKISEAAYEMAKVNFEQTITKTLNEIDTNYFNYRQAINTLANLKETHRYNQRITQYYKNRYNAGISELKDWLMAANTESTSQLAILDAKYKLIQSEATIYSAMGGYYSSKK